MDFVENYLYANAALALALIKSGDSYFQSAAASMKQGDLDDSDVAVCASDASDFTGADSRADTGAGSESDNTQAPTGLEFRVGGV